MSAYRTGADLLRTTRLHAVQTSSPTVKTFSFEDEECANAKPGQYLMLWIPGVDEIPLSILGSKAGKATVAVKNVGEATHALHQLKVGDTIGVRGPFGNHFTLLGHRLLMVGGGTGIVPLLFLTREVLTEKVTVTFVLGAKTEGELLFRNELVSLDHKKIQVVTSTEDGTCGMTGTCVDALQGILKSSKPDMVYCCGPEKMIRKTFMLMEKNKLKMQASLERLMRCSIGLCGSCTVGSFRVCRDGPVFTSEQLRQVKKELGFLKFDEYGKRVSL